MLINCLHFNTTVQVIELTIVMEHFKLHLHTSPLIFFVLSISMLFQNLLRIVVRAQEFFTNYSKMYRMHSCL